MTQKKTKQILSKRARSSIAANLNAKELALSALAFTMWLVSALFYGYEFLHRLAPGIIARELSQDLGIAAGSVGSLSAYYFYAYAAAQLPAGLLLDRIGLRKVLCCACLLVALGSALFAGVNELVMAKFSRALIGLGSAFAFAGTLKIADERFSAKIFPLLVGFTNTFGVMGALIGQYPYAQLVSTLGWRSAMMVIASIGCVLSLLIWLIVRDKEEQSFLEKEESFCSGLTHVIRQPQIWWIAIIAALRVTPIISFAELWAIPFFHQCYNISVVKASVWISFIFVGIALGGPVYGILARFFLRRKLLAIGALGSLFSYLCLLMGWFSYPGITLSLLFLLGFFSSSMLLCFGMAIERVPSFAKGAVIGFLNLWVMLFGAGLQPFIGWLLDKRSHGYGLDSLSLEDYQRALFIVPICLSISWVMTLFLRLKFFTPEKR